MVDVDIDPFGDHDKTDSHPDEKGENNSSKHRRRSDGRIYLGTRPRTRHVVWRRENSRKKAHRFLHGQLVQGAEPRIQPITITLDVKASSFTSKAGMSHSLMRMES